MRQRAVTKSKALLWRTFSLVVLQFMGVERFDIEPRPSSIALSNCTQQTAVKMHSKDQQTLNS